MASGKTWAARVGLVALGVVLAIVGVPAALLLYYSADESDRVVVHTNPSPANEDAKKFGTGELVALAEESRTGCGQYFASDGNRIAFLLEIKVDKSGVAHDAQYVAELSLIKFVADDSAQVPRARPVVLGGGLSGVELTLSSRDFQKSPCLSFNKNSL